MSSLTTQLKTARGKRYIDILKAILSDVGDGIVADAQKIIADTGKITPLCIGRLSLKYDLNYKATCDHLEDRGILPVGTHAILIARGLRVQAVMGELAGNKETL